MFVSIATYRAKAGEEDVIIALHEDWARKQGMKAKDTLSCELLRSLANTREFITIVHYGTKEEIEAIIDDLKQQGLYARVESLVEGELHCSDYTSEWQLP